MSPRASRAIFKACMFMNDFHWARVEGRRLSLDEFHAAGSFAPLGRNPGQVWNLAK